MTEFVSDLLRLVTPIFAISSMASLGLASRPKDIIGSLGNWRLVLGALVASFIFVPALAWAISSLLSLDDPFETGLVLVAVAGGAPFLVKFVETAGGDLALTAAVLVLLLAVTVVYMPLVLPLALSGDVQVDTVGIAATLIVTMVAPFGIALLTRSWSREGSQGLRPLLGLVSTGTLAVLLIGTVLANYDEILDIFGEGAILAALLFIGGAFVSGYLVAGRDPEARTILGFATAQRNIAAATVVATQNFADEPNVFVMVVVTSLVAMALLFPTAMFIGRHSGAVEVEQATRDGLRQSRRMREPDRAVDAGRPAFRSHKVGRKE